MIRMSDYATLPALDVRGGFALGSSMVSAIGTEAPEFVKVSGRAVHAATAALQTDWATKENLSTTDRRPADNRNDRAWSALEGALASAMVVDQTPRGQAAAKVHPKLFKEGLAFTQLPFEKQWAEGDRRLKLIDQDELVDDLILACGGSEFLDEVRAPHDEYGAVLNITEPKTRRAEVNLLDALSRLRAALNVHVSQLVAWGNQNEQNESLARSALQPIDDTRAREAGRGSGTPPQEANVTPDSPLPPAP